MTEQQKKKFHAAKDWTVKELAKHLFHLGMLGILVFAAWLMEPIRENMKEIWNGPKTWARMERKFDDRAVQVDDQLEVMARAISTLQQPSEIFEISRLNSGPIEGFCVELQPCDVRLRIRRRPETVSCQLVPGSVTWNFLNPRTDTISQVQRLDTPQHRNVGTTWEHTDLRIRTPSGLEPNAEFFFTLAYVNCDGVPDNAEPISDESEPIPFVIYKERPE